MSKELVLRTSERLAIDQSVEAQLQVGRSCIGSPICGCTLGSNLILEDDVACSDTRPGYTKCLVAWQLSFPKLRPITSNLKKSRVISCKFPLAAFYWHAIYYRLDFRYMDFL